MLNLTRAGSRPAIRDVSQRLTPGFRGLPKQEERAVREQTAHLVTAQGTAISWPRGQDQEVSLG